MHGTSERECIPQTLAQVQSALRIGLRSFLAGPERKLIEVSMHADEVTIKTDLAKLGERHIQIMVSDDDLSFARFARRERRWIGRSDGLSIPLAGFDCVQKFRGSRLELAVRERAADRNQTPPDVSYELSQAFRRVARAAEPMARYVFATRALKAVADLTASIPEGSLAAAAAASSDYSVLVRALEAPSVVQDMRDRDPLGPARLRGITAQKKVLEAEGGTLRVDEAARLLGLSRQAVDKRRRAGRLIGLDLGRRGYAYPIWQFTNRGTLSGLEPVLSTLHDHDPWMQTAFMLNPNSRLGGVRPLDALKNGRIAEVLVAAQSYLEHGAA